ncbi:molybdenum cofactor cytidylyltransferase [Hyunsoonleella jejuensis]|uniref:Molybdenum cofactor cytidylyltransferase n=1 Tax=Hyunsoonleella jejuensis TaxID=419940 RepID=A0A1H9H078_9FLAO|nr:nucleotidyltransferase family protein [Hyunsoonleella jejuensis]SEQ55772.1 molybdenum cofactor cytidylyltransferase [Hyunsoonleella jejuensis]
MSKYSNITIAILAAGASTRIGSSKQLLKWEDKTLLQHAIHTAKQTTVNKVIVVLGANAEVIASGIKDSSVSTLINNEWQQGLGKSIACVSNFIMNSEDKSDGLLVLLADQPFVTTEHLDKMILQFVKHENGIIATAYNPKQKGVPVLFDKSYFKELSEITGDDGAKSVLKKYSGQLETIIPNFENYDIDTMSDYNRLKKT